MEANDEVDSGSPCATLRSELSGGQKYSARQDNVSD